MIEDEIRQILTAKADALVHRDSARLEALVHADFVYLNAGGRKFDKTGYIDTYCRTGQVVFRGQKVSDLEVSLVGSDIAVATMRLNDRLTTGGRDFDATFQSLAVFVRSAGGWQWAAGQTMNTPD
jgi:hypothetical protein